jgi:hypothetical protein
MFIQVLHSTRPYPASSPASEFRLQLQHTESFMKQLFGIAGLGLGFGVVHVLTGPDHLSALATLSANDTNAFLLGVQWGIGHSFGLVVVATVLIALSSPGNDADGEGGDDDKVRPSLLM